jgi:hypothetical protein
MSRMRILFGVALGLALLAVAAPGALAQSCAMCYQSAAAAQPHAREALRHGILVLLFPPMFIFAGLIGLLYQRRNITRDEVPSDVSAE